MSGRLGDAASPRGGSHPHGVTGATTHGALDSKTLEYVDPETQSETTAVQAEHAEIDLFAAKPADPYNSELSAYCLDASRETNHGG